MEIREFKVSHEYRSEIEELLSDLSEKAVVLQPDFRTNGIFVGAFEGCRLAGIGSMYLIRKPHATKVLIEDVVVNKLYRGQGLGKAITQEIIRIAQVHNVSTIDLTSSHKRAHAHKMYLELGFEEIPLEIQPNPATKYTFPGVKTEERETRLFRFHL